MRALLVLAILVSQVLSVQAGSCHNDPYMRLLTAITRYCVITPASEKANSATCEYDCLISKETVSRPAGGLCPISVKQRLYNDHTSEIVFIDQTRRAFTH
jgi:hypothetical protein